MADPARAHAKNVDGAWFVDATCIACDACRQCAPGLSGGHPRTPGVFGVDRDETSFVARQPASAAERVDATRALLACPVGAIGARGDRASLAGLFPQPLDDGLWYCGYNARDTYGGNAYLARTPAGLVMIDGPRYARPLVDAIAAMGGLGAILLTHQDDVGAAERYAARFSARVFVHEGDAGAVPFATDVIRGDDPARILEGVEALPVPGHTRGSVMFLAGTLLFTGDSLAFDRDTGGLTAFRDVCWYSWPAQKRSLARVDRAFTWVLPGHGQRHRASAAENRAMLRALVARM